MHKIVALEQKNSIVLIFSYITHRSLSKKSANYEPSAI